METVTTVNQAFVETYAVQQPNSYSYSAVYRVFDTFTTVIGGSGAYVFLLEFFILEIRLSRNTRLGLLP